MPKLPVPSHRALNAAWAAVLVVLLAGGVVLTLFVLDLAQSRDVGRADRADLRELVDEQSVIIEDQQARQQLLREQVESLGEEPIVDDGPTLLSPLPVVSRPPTLAQVIVATRTLIDDAVREACDGDCTPEPARDGEDGQDSTVPGPAGRAPTAEEIRAGVAAYCSTRNECRGLPGSTGAAGQDAPRPTFIQCEGIAATTFTFGYSDGSTIAVECGFLEPIEPPAEPEPAE